MKLKPLASVVLATCFVIGGIAVTMVTGLWQTESDKTPRTLKPTEGAAAGEQSVSTDYDPADIRGSYTFGEVSTLFGVPLEELAAAFGLDAAVADAFQAKALESLAPEGGITLGTASLRLFVAYYLGLPYEPTEEVYLRQSAFDVLTRNGRMTADQTAYLTSHLIP